MTYRELVEWIAHIRMENEPKDGPKAPSAGRGIPDWEVQKMKLKQHIAIVQGQGQGAEKRGGKRRVRRPN